MKNDLRDYPYNREKAVAYAHQWAYFRNPNYYNFQDIGGDCTNFASQCVFAGCGIMNYTPTRGWYYVSVSDRAPAWTGVQYLHNFLTSNTGPGPYARVATAAEVQPGDLVQLSLTRPEYQHTPVIVGVEPGLGLEGITVAAHSGDCDCRPLTSYTWRDIRFLHLEGVHYMPPDGE